MKKRWIAALLALVLCISCLGTTGRAASTVKQENVEKQLIDLMKEYCGIRWYVNYLGAIQCKGFADMVSDKLYGLEGGPGPYSGNRYYLPDAETRSYTCLGILKPKACTTENLRILFMKAKPGDYVQCVRYTGTQHSLIVVDVHTTGVTFFDCNLKSSYLCASYFCDWEEIGETFTKGISLYRFSGYKGRSTPCLIFNAKGGKCAMTSKNVTAGKAFGALPTPERKGYVFDYWYYLSFNATPEPDQIKVSASTIKTSYGGTHLYAHWTKDKGPCSLLGHTWTKSKTVKATCEGNGYVVERCTVCGRTRNTNITASLGHKWKLLSSVAATNVTDGADTYQCTRCGDFETRVVLCQLNRFEDISKEDWFYTYVREMVSSALMNGTSRTAFSPDDTLTRAMLVTILWRMQGEPTSMPSAFSDVARNKWYTAAVDWAMDEGVVTGYPDGTFRPNDPLTREQAAAILFRYAPVMGRRNDGRSDVSGFDDSSEISSYARNAMSWAKACGVLSGYPDNTLRPEGEATRAQIAKMIVTFLKKTPLAVK